MLQETQSVDPLDCCDIAEFIRPSWRNECGFHLTWKGSERLVITDYTPKPPTEAPVTSTTTRTNLPKDLMLLPHSVSTLSIHVTNISRMYYTHAYSI